jgi:hypothetical protein
MRGARLRNSWLNSAAAELIPDVQSEAQFSQMCREPRADRPSLQASRLHAQN